MVQDAHDQHEFIRNSIEDTVPPMKEASDTVAQLGVRGACERSITQQREGLIEPPEIDVGDTSAEFTKAVVPDLDEVSASSGRKPKPRHCARGARR